MQEIDKREEKIRGRHVAMRRVLGMYDAIVLCSVANKWYTMLLIYPEQVAATCLFNGAPHCI